MRTSPSGPVVTCESPLPLVNSMRMGPPTVKDLSKLPSALGCEPHPAAIIAASNTATAPRRFRDGIIFVVRLRRLNVQPLRQPFLSEIYEEAQPEVPCAAPAQFRLFG